VLAGGNGWLMDQFPNLLDELGLRSDVVLTGYVDDRALQWLYQNCYAHVYPSLYEGFGLPVLEAMSQGAPVIASNTTSLPEVVGEVGLLVDPLDQAAITGALRRLWLDRDLRRRLAGSSIDQAARFSWSASARAVLEGYELLRWTNDAQPARHAPSPAPLVRGVPQMAASVTDS
jgi:glycosyltransferase involved in cell wall biosynthesis